LVVITPAAGFVTPGWSIAIGALGAPWCYLTVEAVNRIKLVDDTLDAFGLHGSGGFAGAILTGIFAVDEGLIYSGSFVLLGKQIAGALAGVAFSAVGTAIIMGVMKMLFKLRIPEDQELGGVDEHTHGESYSYNSSTKTYAAGGRMTEQTAERILTEMMNVDLSMISFDFSAVERQEEEIDSPSFPGVTTVYRKELVECKGNTKFFQWLTEAQAEAQKVKLSVHGSHISTLVRAPIGLDEEALKEYLKSCGIDITKFGQDGTKSLKEFSSELIKGETRLLQVPSGEILVITEVVMMILQNPETKETLVQTGLIYSGSFVLLGKQIAGALAGVAFSAVGTAIIMGVMKMLFKLRIPEDQELGGVDEHTHGESYHSPVKRYAPGGRMTESETSKESVWPDGKTSNQARIPGAKRRPDENQFLCARRILKRQLEIDENAVRISQEVGYIEEDRSSRSYPGLKTVYRKRIIKGEVIPGA
ncbi:amt1, partial [Symbiodinium sp. KB8]